MSEVRERRDAGADGAGQFASYCIVELLGHRRLAAYVTEQTVAGAGFLRLDVPGDPALLTQYVSPASIYCLTPCSEAVARSVAAHHTPAPVQPYELLPPSAPRGVRRFEEPDYESPADREDGESEHGDDYDEVGR